MSAKQMSMRRKITVSLILMLLCFGAIIGKLAHIQIAQGDELQLKAAESRTRDQVVSPLRGTIFDREGQKLAISITADSVSISPPTIANNENGDEVAALLARELNLDITTIREMIAQESQFVWVKRKVDFAIADSIRQADLAGINIIGESQRYYPRGTLAANIIGYAGIDNQGLEGLELILDDVLTGAPGMITGEYDARGNSLPQAEYDYVSPTNGYDVYLTIDENIQYFAERELDELMASEIAPKSAGVIIMRPQTGEILAWAQRPSYDPNYYQEADISVQRNILNSNIYEPGSTFKIITTSAAIEEGTSTLDSTYYCSGSAQIYDSNISCWRSYNPHGSQNFTESLQNSCNPAMIAMQQALESKEDGLFYKYIHAFGFGEQTGILLPGEAAGLLQSGSNLGPVELATSAIGQGISVTPLQMVTAVSAVANGGVLLEPQLVYQIKDGEQIIQDYQVKEVRQVISAETSDIMCNVLESVVTNGTGSKAYIEGYRVGGKTGTAQKPEAGGYAEDKYVGSFIGMAPVNDPQIVALVVVDEAVYGFHQGSQSAAPVFAAIVEDTMRYLGVVPQITSEAAPEDSINMVEVPDLSGLSAEAALQILNMLDLDIELRGSGNAVIEQVPAAYAKVESGTTVIVTMAQSLNNQIVVPDLTGERLSSAMEMLGIIGLKLEAEGNSGTAYQQDPIPGSLVEPGAVITVKFAEPEQLFDPLLNPALDPNMPQP